MPSPAPLLQGTSPIYNLLPDILSNLSRYQGITKPKFQAIMQQVRAGWKGGGPLEASPWERGRGVSCVCMCASFCPVGASSPFLLGLPPAG